MEIHESLRKIRVKNGLSQNQIAKELSTTQQQYCKYENGTREIPIHHILTLCKLYKAPINEVLGLQQEIENKDIRQKFEKLYEEIIDILYHAEDQRFINYEQREYLLETIEQAKYEIEKGEIK